MLKKTLLILLCALGACLSHANPDHVTNLSPEVNFKTTDDCNLPAPIDFHVEERGSGWVKMKWSPVAPGFVSHRIRTFNANGDVLVSTKTAPAGQNSIVVDGLTFGEEYYSVITAICSDGTDSKYFTTSGRFGVIITELIVSGFTPTTAPTTCGVHSTGDYCEFPATTAETYFEIHNINTPSLYRQFQTYYLPTSNVLRAKVSSTSGFFQFRIDDSIPNSNGVAGIHFRVFANNGTILVATFQLYEVTKNGQIVDRLICESMSPAYEIVRRGGANKPAPSSGMLEGLHTRDEGNVALSGVVVSPNPFSDFLNVDLGEWTGEKVELSLFDLSGRQIRSMSFSETQGAISISTADLSPGFYLLKIQANGLEQTYKVIK